MRSVLRLAIWLLCLAYLPTANAACGEYDKPCEKPLQLGKIESITIEENWKVDEDSNNPRNMCEDLHPLTPDDLAKYFKQAGRIDDVVHNEYITVSACRASGTMKIDGLNAYWDIGMLSDGYISWAENPGKPPPAAPKMPVHTYCQQCGPPFSRPY